MAGNGTFTSRSEGFLNLFLSCIFLSTESKMSASCGKLSKFPNNKTNWKKTSATRRKVSKFPTQSQTFLSVCLNREMNSSKFLYGMECLFPSFWMKIEACPCIFILHFLFKRTERKFQLLVGNFQSFLTKSNFSFTLFKQKNQNFLMIWRGRRVARITFRQS